VSTVVNAEHCSSLPATREKGRLELLSARALLFGISKDEVAIDAARLSRCHGTSAAPTASAADPTSVPNSAATLAGIVDTHGLSGTYRFEVLWLSGSYSVSTQVGPVPVGSGDQRVAALVSGLPAGRTFRVRSVVASDDATAFGDEVAFATVPGAAVTPAPPRGNAAMPCGCRELAVTDRVRFTPAHGRQDGLTHLQAHGWPLRPDRPGPFPKDSSMDNRAQVNACSVGGSRRPSRARRAGAALMAIGAAITATIGVSAVPALGDTCSNAAVRAQSNSTRLPDCRAYEMVTPPVKEGFAPVVPSYSDRGDAFSYQSAGQFAGNGNGGDQNQYVATRSATGWTTVSPGPSASTFGNLLAPGNAEAMSADLGSSVWLMARAGESSEVLDIYLRGPDGAFTRIGPALNPATRPPSSPGTFSGDAPRYLAASSDLSHVMFSVRSDQAFSGAAVGDADRVLYQYEGVGSDAPQQVGVDNDGHQIAACDTRAGSGTRSAYRAMSADGRVIFFAEDCTPIGGIAQVWARVDGTTTYQVSASLCTRAPSDPGGACNDPAGADFEGANADGTRVYFTTTQQLVNGDTDQTNDLYACDIPSGATPPVGVANSCSALREVSGAASDADVEGVVRVSDDGSRVYFVAHGVLAANLGANDLGAVAGEDNLYVWREDAAHPAGQTIFVGKLDLADSPLWGTEVGTGGRMAQTTDDGRYLVLSTYAPLVAGDPGADTDTAQDVYRFDAANGSLARLSTTISGDGGNAPGLAATIDRIDYRGENATARSRTAMTSDGRTVVFRTAEALSPADTNGVPDVYAWHDGRVSLISSGERSFDDQVAPASTGALITASGQDIYFSTTAQLTPSDTDTQVDFYDARIGGGFPVAQPVAACSDDGCQGTPSVPPGASQASSNVPTGQADVPRAAPAFSLRAVSPAQRKRLASTGKLTLTVTANTAASLTARATATVAGKTVSVASARRTLAVPGSVSLVLTLSKKARAQLSALGTLTVKVVVSDSSVAITRSVTLKLTRAKTKTASKSKAAMKPPVGAATSRKGGRS
jgi:hypothetical protein